MIIRERQNDIVMISQDDHARISGQFALQWKDSFFLGSDKRVSVELAIAEHDRGWIPVDDAPFLNDKTNLPYTFMDFPSVSKFVFYKHGIDDVQVMDDYAAILCSHHYARFAEDDKSEEAREFVRNEKERQHKIKGQLENYDPKLFPFHYDLLNFCDNLSLYVCLNEPGVSKADEHYFYKEGFPVPDTFSFFKNQKLDIGWVDEQTISLEEFPFTEPFYVEIKQRVVAKKDIAMKGLLDAYQEAADEVVRVVIKCGK